MKDPSGRCAVEVGVHPEPYWKDRNSDLVVCDRHRQQMDERSPDEELPGFEWEKA